MDEFNNKVMRAIEEKRNVLCEAAVNRQYDLQPEIWKPFGEQGLRRSIRDADHHFSYLIEALSESDPSLFGGYVLWLKDLFVGLKFHNDALPVMLACTRDALKYHLPQEMSLITDQYIQVALGELGQQALPQPSFITEEAPLFELAREYLDALLKGERHLASRLIVDSVEKGESIKEIYLNVFQRSQYEIGRLWHTNQVSVAQEHYCSAATQLIMSQLYPYIFSTEKIGRKFVAASVGGELHEIGIRMVADFFELEGWDTYYMGANTPTESILSAVEDYQPDILGISATMPLHRSALKDLISEVRSSDACKGVKILVGGYTLKASPALWRKMGADGFAHDALDATVLAAGLMSEQAAS